MYRISTIIVRASLLCLVLTTLLGMGASALTAAELRLPASEPSQNPDAATVPLGGGTSSAPAYSAPLDPTFTPPAPVDRAPSTAPPVYAVPQSAPLTVPEVWRPLLARLAAEGISGPDVDMMFIALGEQATQDPMGRKVRELYTKTFLRKPPDPNAPKVPRLRLYKGVVTPENAQTCRNFIAQNIAAFTRAQQRYGVPPETAAALLFVETRLGTSMGKERALYTLASMARSDTPDTIIDWLPQLPDYTLHLDWMQELMPKRAEWAYKELKALVVHLRTQGIEAATVPGSIYGAVGMCQFMPSNLIPYGADGDDDGVIDLFTVPDAVESLSNYLSKHGWKAGSTRAAQHAVLKTYNRVDIYANTIMALADLIAGRSLPLPTDTKIKKQKSRPQP